MDNKSKKMIIAGATVLTGFTLSQFARNRWFKIYDEEPPSTHPSKDINWKKAILWSIVTGTVISSVKIATQRFLTIKLNS